MCGKTIIIKQGKNSFEKFYNKKFEEAGYSCYTPYINMNKVMDFICHIFQHFKLPFYKRFYGEWTKVIKNVDMVIIFDWIYSHQIINDIYKMNKNCKVVFWIWNKIEERISEKISSDNIDVYWSFDPLDVKTFHMKFNTQFYAITTKDLEQKKMDSLKPHLIYDVFFCGAEKNRKKKIIDLYTLLDGYGLTCKFIIQGDGDSNYGIIYNKNYIAYEKNIEYIQNSRCIIDITNGCQTGLTIRALEALYYSKLLITDNVEIIKSVFYDKKYIYILGHEDRSIVEFLQTDMPSYSAENKKYYSIEEWVKRFE